MSGDSSSSGRALCCEQLFGIKCTVGRDRHSTEVTGSFLIF